MADCLSCVELEQKLCELAEEIAAASCDTQIWKEGDTTRDGTAGLQAKVDVMNMYRDLYTSKKCGSDGELYEFIHVPCVTPVTCVGTVCRTVPAVREQRRYRR